MRVVIVLLFLVFATHVSAQLPDAELKKITEKNLHLLRKAQLQENVPQPVQLPALSPNIYSLQQDGMPCVVPDTSNIAPMPNAQPEFKLPDVAAIPNPALHNNLQKYKALEPGASK